jgi:hypothetical protein
MLRNKAIAAVLALSLAMPLATPAAAGHKAERHGNHGYQGQVYQGHNHKYERKKHRRDHAERRHHVDRGHRNHHRRHHVEKGYPSAYPYNHKRRHHDHRSYGKRNHGYWHKHYGGHRHWHGDHRRHDHYGHKHRGHKHGYGHRHSSKKSDKDAYLVAAGVVGLVAAAAIINHQDSYRDTPKDTITWNDPNAGGGAIYGEPGRVVDHPEGDYCREYHRDATVGGRQQQVYGTACLQPDGSWEIVQER